MRKKSVVILLIVSMLVTFMPAMTFAVEENLNEHREPVVIAKGVASGKKAVKLSWLKTKGATSYSVKGSLTGYGLKTIKQKTTKKSLTVKKISGKTLKANQVYRFIVTAYKGTTQLAKSKTVYVITNKTYRKKYANVSKVTVKGNDKVIYMDERTYDIYVGEPIVNIYKNKKHLSTAYAPKIRYTTDSPSVFTVSSKGKITPYSPGQGTIYVQTINGKYDTVSVKIGKFSYVVKFDSNDASTPGVKATGTMKDQIFIETEAQKLYPNAFTKKGYKFQSWNTKPDGTGVTYEDKAEIKIDSNTTLYAQWVEHQEEEEPTGGGGGKDPVTPSYSDAKEAAIAAIEEARDCSIYGDNREYTPSDEVKAIVASAEALIKDSSTSDDAAKEISDKAVLEIAKQKAREKVKSLIEGDLSDQSEKVRDMFDASMSQIVKCTTTADAAKKRDQGYVKIKNRLQAEDYIEDIGKAITDIEKATTNYYDNGEGKGIKESIPMKFQTDAMKKIVASAEAELKKLSADADENDKAGNTVIEDYQKTIEKKIKEQHEKEGVIKYNSNEGNGDVYYQVELISEMTTENSKNVPFAAESSANMTAPNYDTEKHALGGKIFYYSGIDNDAKYTFFDENGKPVLSAEGTIITDASGNVFELSAGASESATVEQLRAKISADARETVALINTNFLNDKIAGIKSEISAEAVNAINAVSDNASLSDNAKEAAISQLNEIKSSADATVSTLNSLQSVYAYRDNALNNIQAVLDSISNEATADATANAKKTINDVSGNVLAQINNLHVSDNAKSNMAGKVSSIVSSAEALLLNSVTTTAEAYQIRTLYVNKLNIINEFIDAANNVSSDAVAEKLVSSVNAIVSADSLDYLQTVRENGIAAIKDATDDYHFNNKLKELGYNDITEGIASSTNLSIFDNVTSYAVDNKNGHLAGWNTDKDWAGTHYSVNGSLELHKEEMITLYAEWDVEDQFYVVALEDNVVFMSDNQLTWGDSKIKRLIGGNVLDEIGSGRDNSRMALSSKNVDLCKSNSQGGLWYWLKQNNNNNLSGCNDWYIGSQAEFEKLYYSKVAEARFNEGWVLWTSVQSNNGNYNVSTEVMKNTDGHYKTDTVVIDKVDNYPHALMFRSF